MDKRVEKAVKLFNEGFNCSQAIVGAFADKYELDTKIALRLSSSFGGGIGRMRETCGAACGMFIIAGLENGSDVENDKEGKKRNYELVQKLAEEFKKRNGSINCSELLGISKKNISAVPRERNEEYYKKRPCVKIVEEAAMILNDYYNNKI